MHDMPSTPSPRDTFPLRFKDARNREALKRMAELTGQSMTVVAERAIEHEVVLLSADLEVRLADALEAVRGYLPEQHLDRYLDAAADDEGADLGPGLRAIATDADGPSGVRAPGAEALVVLEAFARR